MKLSKIELEFSSDKIKKDLENLSKLAIDLGAYDVKIVDPKTDVYLDFRAKIKCSIPKCMFYGTNINCPPYSPSLEDMEKLFSCIEVALLIGIHLPSELVAPIKKEDLKKWSNAPELFKMFRDHSRIVGSVESEAYQKGYYFATAFGGGSCKSTYCPYEPCQALGKKGNRCRHFLKARPCMEGSGIDVFKTATKAGWDIYPVGRKHVAGDIPNGFNVGLVLIY